MSVEAIADALEAEGFRPSPPMQRGAYCFAGMIACNNQLVPVEIEISDLDFVKLPTIRVLERPEKLQGFQPHFGANDELCYADKNEVVLDRYRPAESIVGCLHKASAVLSDLARKRPPNDTHAEFLVYWPGEPLLLACKRDYSGSASLISMKTKNGTPVLVACEDTDAITDQLSKIGWSVTTASQNNCYVIISNYAPAVFATKWPPHTLGEVFSWIKEIDIKAYRAIYRQLAEPWVLKSGLAAFIFRSPTVDFGFYFAVDRIHAKTCKRKPAIYRDFLTHKGSVTKVKLFRAYPFDQHYVHSRNLGDGKNLYNKRVLIAGCGTIGGYLATYLARLGAGQGDQGKLILADPDALVPANIGRHVLGMDSLLQNKAVAVADLILRDFPHLNVIARDADVRMIKELNEVDIFIDATGEEALSAALNEQFAQRRRDQKKTPVALYVWIVGPGVAVQSLLVDSLDYSCYRCLRVTGPNGELAERFSALSDGTTPQMVRVGCDTYTPFPVSVSVQAAALAIDHVLGWLRGKPSPRLRTRIVDKARGRIVKDQDPEPLSDCPACRKK